MNLPPWRMTPGEMFVQMRHEMDQLFQRLMGETTRGPGKDSGATWSPRIDMEETPQEFLIKVDLPGVDMTAVDITVAEGALLIQGERREDRDETRKQFHFLERYVGKFFRSIPLAASADTDKIQASSARGVLTIIVVKKLEVQPKKVIIQSHD